MIAVDLSDDIIIPTGVAIVGALVAGISAVLKSWIENRDARSRGDRRLDLAKRRTDFANDWIEISRKLDDRQTNNDDNDDNGPRFAEVEPADSKVRKDLLIERAHQELLQSAQETEVAFYEATTDTSTGLLQFRRLLMLVRRRNLASYVVSGLFLFVSVGVWLVVCIPTPGNDGFSIPGAIFVSIVATFVLRAAAGLAVSGLERHAISPHEKIADVSVKDGVVTITTEAEHGFEAEQQVMVDASLDKFDGMATLIDADGNWFTFERRAANATSLPHVTGWVCGDSVKEQMKRLFLIPSGGNRLAWGVTALFLLPLLVFSGVEANHTQHELERVGYPRCVGGPYDGAYYGGLGLYVTPDGVEKFLEQAPPWSESKIQMKIKNVKREESGADSSNESGYLIEPDQEGGSWTLEDNNGDEYSLDMDGLRYKDGKTVLYKKVRGDQLQKAGDPCDPQQQTVTISKEMELLIGGEPDLSISEADDFSIPVFSFYDESAGYLTGDDLLNMYLGEGEGETKKIQVYFGRDGRLIPVCDSANYPEIQPCLERDDAYLDSGLEATVALSVTTGIKILSLAIAWRLFFWIVAKLVVRGPKDPNQHDPEPATIAGTPPLSPVP